MGVEANEGVDVRDGTSLHLHHFDELTRTELGDTPWLFSFLARFRRKVIVKRRHSSGRCQVNSTCPRYS